MRTLSLIGLLLLFAAAASAETPRLRPPSPTRWAVDGGYGLRLWDAQDAGSAEQQSYQEKAKRGWVLGGDVAVFPWEPFGVGVSYFRFMKTITASDIGFGDGSRGESTDIYLIEFIGPSVSFRKSVFGLESVFQAGGGVIYYDNQHQAPDFPGVLQSVAPGAYASAALDYRLTRWFGVGVGARVLYGSLDNVSYNGQDVDVPTISLTRVDFTGGIRFYP